MALQNAVVAMLVKCALNFELISNSVTSKHPYTITPPPPCFTVGTTHVETICSPCVLQRPSKCNQKSWTPEVRISTGPISIPCFSWPKPFSSSCCCSSVVASLQQFNHDWFTQSPLNSWCWDLSATSFTWALIRGAVYLQFPLPISYYGPPFLGW